MDTLNLLMQGFITAATPINLMWAFVGCIIGTAVGVLPSMAVTMEPASPGVFSRMDVVEPPYMAP